VTEVISDNIGVDAVNFTDDRSMSSRFTRAIALYWLFVEPHNNGTPLEFPLDPSTKSDYSNTMELGEKTLAQANSHYEKLMEVGAAYFKSGVKPIRQVEDSLKKLTHEILNFVCSLIARFVLLQERTPFQRRSRLLSMGFDRYDELPVLGATRWAILLLGIGIITIALVIVTPRAVPLPKGEAFLRAVVFLMQIGISVAAGTFVAERFAKSQGNKRGLILLFELTVACLIVITMSSALRIGGSLVSATLLKHGNGEFGEILSEFIDRWSVLIYPVANTISITFACSFLTELAWGRFGLVVLGAIFNGLVFVVAALAAGMLLPNPVLTELNANMWVARLTVVLNSGLIGATVGGMVVAMFKRTRQIESSQQLAYSAGYEAARGWEPSLQKGEWAERPLGGYSRTNVEELVGTYVCFRPVFAEPDTVNAYLVKIQWDAKQSCLVFQETERADITYTQIGKIYVPDGKPFMNLVTAEKGDLRLITVSRPDPQGFARGLIMTLSVPGGVNYLPASGPIVLKKVGNQEIPKRGFVKPDHPDYNFYRSELIKVIPSFGVLIEPAMAPSLEVQA
jgi:hypothetical protein